MPRARSQYHTATIFLYPHTSCDKSCHLPWGLKQHIATVHPKHVQNPVLVNEDYPDEDGEGMDAGGVDPVLENGIEPPLQAVTHYHSIIDGQ